MAVLLFGPDGGLVRERAAGLVARTVDDPDDPFRVTELSGETLREDPARLVDEAAAISFFGGRRVVRVREAGDGTANLFEALLADSPGDALVVAEAGDLPPRSSLRRLFESSGRGAAIPCYRDEGRDLAELARAQLTEAGLSIKSDAIAFLTENLGGDRQVSRRELEKLVLYKANDQTEVTLEDVALCIGNSSALTRSNVALAVGAGDLKRLAIDLPRALREGTQPVTLLRAVAGHFHRLHLVSSSINSGKPRDAALKGLKPPLFWKDRDAFLAQLKMWDERDLGRALGYLLEAEQATKRTGAPAEAILGNVLFKLASRADQRRARLS